MVLCFFGDTHTLFDNLNNSLSKHKHQLLRNKFIITTSNSKQPTIRNGGQNDNDDGDEDYLISSHRVITPLFEFDERN